MPLHHAVEQPARHRQGQLVHLPIRQLERHPRRDLCFLQQRVEVAQEGLTFAAHLADQGRLEPRPLFRHAEVDQRGAGRPIHHRLQHPPPGLVRLRRILLGRQPLEDEVQRVAQLLPEVLNLRLSQSLAPRGLGQRLLHPLAARPTEVNQRFLRKERSRITKLRRSHPGRNAEQHRAPTHDPERRSMLEVHDSLLAQGLRVVVQPPAAPPRRPALSASPHHTTPTARRRQWSLCKPVNPTRPTCGADVACTSVHLFTQSTGRKPGDMTVHSEHRAQALVT